MYSKDTIYTRTKDLFRNIDILIIDKFLVLHYEDSYCIRFVIGRYILFCETWCNVSQINEQKNLNNL